MLITALVIGIMSSVLEIKLVTRSKWLLDKYQNGWGPIPGSFFDLVGSVVISGLIGAGAGGTVMGFMAGVVGIFSSTVFWGIRKKAIDTGWTVDRIKTETNDFVEKTKTQAIALFKVARLAWKTFMLPITIIAAIITKCSNAKAAFTEFKSKALA